MLCNIINKFRLLLKRHFSIAGTLSFILQLRKVMGDVQLWQKFDKRRPRSGDKFTSQIINIIFFIRKMFFYFYFLIVKRNTAGI